MSGPAVPICTDYPWILKLSTELCALSVSPVTLGELITGTPGCDLKPVSLFSAVINFTPFSPFFLLY